MPGSLFALATSREPGRIEGMEASRIAEIRRLLEALKGDNGKTPPLSFYPEWTGIGDQRGQHHGPLVVYPDGDACAVVDDNLAYGYVGNHYAEFFAASPKIVEELLAALPEP